MTDVKNEESQEQRKQADEVDPLANDGEELLAQPSSNETEAEVAEDHVLESSIEGSEQADSSEKSRKEPNSEDFARLLERRIANVGTVEQGEMVRGQIIDITEEYAFVDVGGKTEGLISLAELKDNDGQLKVEVGDEVEAFVVSTRRGEIHLSQALGKQIRDEEALYDCFDAGIPVEGKVEGTNKGGYDVIVAGRRAFCPISQMEMRYTEDPSVHVGQSYEFRVVEMSEKGKRIVVSRTALLREEDEERKQMLKDSLEVGMEFSGRVTSIQDYGAFVDLGGLEGLVHVSEISWGRLEHPSEALKEGDKVSVKVLEIKESEKGPRISLSIRETTPHPWIAVGTTFVEGGTYQGVVTRLLAFGAFVELGPGVEGLVHVSEMSWEKRVNHPKELLNVGDSVKVYIKSIDHQRKRIALSLKALQKDPWEEAAERYSQGDTITGTVERVEPFGVFVQVENGVTALLPASESGTGTVQDLRRQFQPGNSVTAGVLNVEPSRRRMSLSIKALSEAKAEASMKEYRDNQKDENKSGSFGTIGDLFGDRLKKR